MGSDTLLWRHGRVYDLNVFLPSESGRSLSEARGTNNRGQIIGTGRGDGNQRGLWLTPGGEGHGATVDSTCESTA